MLLTAVIMKDELVKLLDSLAPVRVVVDEERDRVVTLDHPELELVPDRGLRVRGDAHVSWDFARVPIPVTINSWQLLFVPRIASANRSHVLSFEPIIEDLDVKLVPGFVDEKIVTTIRGGVARYRERLAWNCARTLSRRLPLPRKISPPKTFEIRVVGGEVNVSEIDVRLAVRFEAAFENRTDVGEPAREKGPSVAAMHR